MTAVRLRIASPGGHRTGTDCAILPDADAARGRPALVVAGREVRVGAPQPTGATAAAAVASAGAEAALLVRRGRDGAWRLDGAAVPLDLRTEPHLARALGAERVVRLLGTAPVRVVDDHRAATAVLLRAREDAVVVLTCPGRGERLVAAGEEALAAAAAAVLAAHQPAAGAAHGASGAPADRRAPGASAGELRALRAVQAMTGALEAAPGEALRRVADVLLEATDGAVAAAWTRSGGAVASRSGAGAPTAVPDARAVLAAAAAALPGAGVLRSGALPAPLSPRDGVTAWLALPLAASGGGVLVARTAPAGPFEAGAAELAEQLALTADTLLRVVDAREQVERQLSDTRLQLGRDALTHVGSRHRWDEELTAAQGLVDAGVPVAVALLDLDDLKRVNDTHGHPAGDELLRTCAAALRGCLRDSSDVVARVGGDEFAVLVPRAADVEALATRLRSGVESARTPDGLPLRASVGAALAEPGTRVADAFAAADAAMYADKRRRRAARGQVAGRPRTA